MTYAQMILENEFRPGEEKTAVGTLVKPGH